MSSARTEHMLRATHGKSASHRPINFARCGNISRILAICWFVNTEHLDLPHMGGARNRPASAALARIQLEYLSSILSALEDVQVVAEAANGKEACELYHQHSPDVLIVDLRMPEKDGLQVVTELMAGRARKPRIIVITTYESEEDIRRAVCAGAKGYLLKAADAEQIEEAVRAVAAGRTLFPTEITLKLAESVAHPELTKRELEVLRYIANGRSNKEIGAILYISEATVKGHVRSILTKLEAIGRAEAIAIAAKRGLIRVNA